MGRRVSATGIVSTLLIVVLTITGTGAAARQSRLWHHGEFSGMSVQWRERFVSGDGEFGGGFFSRRLLVARRRGGAGVESKERKPYSHFTAAFSFFSSMAKGSSSPSPATPSPGHN